MPTDTFHIWLLCALSYTQSVITTSQCGRGAIIYCLKVVLQKKGGGRGVGMFPGAYGINKPIVQSRITVLCFLHILHWVCTNYPRAQLFRDKLHKPELTETLMSWLTIYLASIKGSSTMQFQWSGQKPYPQGHLHHCLLGSLCSLRCSGLHKEKRKKEETAVESSFDKLQFAH